MIYKNVKIPLNLFTGKNIYQFLGELYYSGRTGILYDTMHFFYEQGRLEIRVGGNSYDNMDTIIDWIKDYFGEEKERKVGQIIVEDYQPEIDRFGDFGWHIIEKLFEYGSRAAIYIRNRDDSIGEGMGDRGNQFREGKIVHCFLNQLGMDSLSEASFHNFQAQQMMLKHIRESEIPIYPVTMPVAILEEQNKEKKDREKKETGPEFG